MEGIGGQAPSDQTRMEADPERSRAAKFCGLHRNGETLHTGFQQVGWTASSAKTAGSPPQKLIVLASVYSLTPEQMLALCPPAGGSTPSDDISIPNATLLTGGARWRPTRRAGFQTASSLDTPPELTALLPSEPGLLPGPTTGAELFGRQDRTLETDDPTWIDRFSSIPQSVPSPTERSGNHEFDRPGLLSS